uniref:Uncharacterized protein n=1 Tax=Heterorhabditis bacteriophora TaxID=37862 RepID=A0A1I7X4A4_HETBA
MYEQNNLVFFRSLPKNKIVINDCSKRLSESNNGVIPQITGSLPHREGTTQSGETSFGTIRGQVTRVKDKDRKRRSTVHNSSGGRRFTQEEIDRSRAAIPRFHDPRPIIAKIKQKNEESTLIKGIDETPIDQADTNRYLAWLGGQVTLQSNAGRSAENRAILSKSYYNYLMTARQLDPDMIRKRLEGHKNQNRKDGRALDANGIESCSKEMLETVSRNVADYTND